MNYDEIADMVQGHEGFSEEIYLDSKGIPTVGSGIALTVGKKLPIKCLIQMFNDAFRQAIESCNACERFFGVELDSVRRAVVIDMCFCLGRRGVFGFREMWKAIQSDDFKEAAAQIIDSKWHRDLEKIRGNRDIETRTMEIARMMEEGEE